MESQRPSAAHDSFVSPVAEPVRDEAVNLNADIGSSPSPFPPPEPPLPQSSQHDAPDSTLGHDQFQSPLDRREMRRRERERMRDTPLDWWLELMVVVTVFSSVLAVGSVHIPTLLVVGTLSIGAGVLAMYLYRKRMGAWPISLPVVIVAAMTGYTALQAIALPQQWVTLLAPNNAEVWRYCLESLGKPGPQWHPISLDPGATWEQVLRGMSYVGIIIASSVIAYRRGAVFGVATVFVSSLVAGIITLTHGLLGITKVFGLYEPVHSFAVWHIGPLLNANHLAGYLNLGVMCGLGILLKYRPVAPRWLVGIGTAMLVGLVVTTASRAGVLLVVPGVALLVWLLRTRTKHGDGHGANANWLRWVSVAVVLGGLALAALGLTTKQWDELLHEDLSKLEMFAWAKPLVLDHFYWGIGRGAFETVYPAYRATYGHKLWTHPENLLVQWSAEWGVPCAVAFALCFAWILRPSRMGARRSAVAAGTLAGIWIVVAQNMVDFSLETPGVAIAVMSLVGACWGDTRRRGVSRWDSTSFSGELENSATPLEGGVLRRLVTRPLGWYKRLVDRWQRKWGFGVSHKKSQKPSKAGVAGWIQKQGGIWTLAFLGCVSVGMTAYKAIPTPLEDRLHFEKLATDQLVSKAAFHELLQEAMLRHPAEPYLALVAAERAWRNRNDEPLRFLTRVLERAKVYGRAHFLLAEVMLARGALTQGLMELKLACRDEQALATPAVALALHYTKDGKHLQRLVPEPELYPKQAAVVLDTLGAWMHSRDVELGQRFDAQTLELDPTRLAPRERLALGLVRQLSDANTSEEQKNKIVAQVERHAHYLQKAEPNKSRWARVRAKLLEAQGKQQQAQELLHQVCDQVKDRYTCLKARVPLVQALGNDDELRQLLDATALAGCTNAPACAQSYKWLATVHQGRKNYGAAANALVRVTRYDPMNAQAWEELGDMNAIIGTYGQATQAYARARKLKPNDTRLQSKEQAAKAKILPGLLDR